MELFIQMAIFAKAEKMLKLKFILLIFDFEHKKQLEKDTILLIITLFFSGISKLFTFRTNIKSNTVLLEYVMT